MSDHTPCEVDASLHGHFVKQHRHTAAYLTRPHIAKSLLLVDLSAALEFERRPLDLCIALRGFNWWAALTLGAVELVAYPLIVSLLFGVIRTVEFLGAEGLESLY